MSPLFLCVYGHVALDYILQLENFPEPNTSVDILEKKRFFGGTGANIATIASSLGVPTALCSFVGNDFPDDFRRFMIDRGVDLRDLVKVEDDETPLVWIVSNSSHDQVAYVYQGAMRRMDAFEVRIGAARESKFVHICTGRPGYYLKVIKACREMNKFISFDPSQEIHHIWSEKDFCEAISQCDAFFANDSEMRTAMRYMHVQTPEELSTRLKFLVNTKGKEGCDIYEGKNRISVPAFNSKKIVDTTGAGDAFRAGFYAALYRGMTLRECAAAGSATASFIIESQGSLTNIPDWKDVEKRMSEILSNH
ncbi:MAG: carbohydrate kinase family protein [Methanomassiliicoccales archaeon]|jgi:sugar/nucleoside kinase (ribokinase family)|nr:carbohydrate kinase family protein [Methanomassiliicoccales archaeon]